MARRLWCGASAAGWETPLLRGQNSTKHRFASIPAYTAAKEGVQTGIVRRRCTHEYKVRVIERYLLRELLGLKPGQRILKDSPRVAGLRNFSGREEVRQPLRLYLLIEDLIMRPGRLPRNPPTVR